MRFSILNISLSLCGLLLLNSLEANACTQEQAFNKMIALGQAQSKIMAEQQKYPPATAKHNELSRRGSDLTIRVGSVGPKLQEGKFAEACAEYDKIAKDFNIDIGKESEGMITVEELKKDGGRRGGICTQAEASILHNKMFDTLVKRRDSGKISSRVIDSFAKDTEDLAPLMYRDPSAVCRKLNRLKGKYHL